MEKRWSICSPDRSRARELAQALGIHPALAVVLINRGIDNADAAQVFLNPSLSQLELKTPLRDMDRAVARVASAIIDSENIGVHGDFDADGLTATALLLGFLHEVQVPTSSFIPHRINHGYGMSRAGVDALKEQGAKLIIAVDCGSSDREVIEYANGLGLSVVVLDHHQVPAARPPALALVNPCRDDCPSGLTGLCAAGLAFLFLIELRSCLREKGFFKDRPEPNLKRMMDLAALGTIADVVPVTGINRVLVRFGLEEINRNNRIGLKMLKHSAVLGERNLTAYNIAFNIAPRINAAGRLEDAMLSLRLLLSKDVEEARTLAEALERLNTTRQRVEERILNEALEQVDSDRDFEKRSSVVVAGAGWHPGVIGIVASRLQEKFFRPAAVITFTGGVGRGSLRSVRGLDLVSALSRCSGHLLRYGGHSMAAGISIAEEAYAAFRTRFDEVVAEDFTRLERVPTLIVDAEWPLTRIDMTMVRDLEKLAPTGEGNPPPRFCARGVLVRNIRVVRGSTLMMTMQEGKTAVEAVAFNQADDPPLANRPIDIVYVPEINNYQGDEKLRINVKSIKM